MMVVYMLQEMSGVFNLRNVRLKRFNRLKIAKRISLSFNL